MQLFADAMHNEFAEWALATVGGDGADFGEIEAIAGGMEGDDDSAYYAAWYGASTRHLEAARDAEQRRKLHTARHHYLRATVCAGVSYRPLYGRPVDPRLATAFETQMDAFQRALALDDRPAEQLDVTLDGHRMTVFFLPAAGAPTDQPRPVVIATNGYDASVSDQYFAMGLAATARGYHFVLVDGPGQGAMLIRDGVTMIPDWDRVTRAVVDAVVGRPDVDSKRIVLQGWSLGGHLALRGAAGEPRLAACVVDPPLWSMLAGMKPLAAAFGLSAEAAARLPEISDADTATLTAAIERVPRLRWSIMQRGFWVNGASDLREYLQLVVPFTMDGHSDGIRCPVLGTAAEGDPLAQGAEEALGRLEVPTTLIRFTAAEGAGEHCEFQNRALAETRILDWIDDTLS